MELAHQQRIKLARRFLPFRSLVGGWGGLALLAPDRAQGPPVSLVPNTWSRLLGCDHIEGERKRW
jgi:hypothetical protein